VVPFLQRKSRSRLLIPALLVIFGMVNGAATYKVTQLYRARQRSDQVVFKGLAELRAVLKYCGHLTLMTDATTMKSSPFVAPEVLTSMSYLVVNRDLPVSVDTVLSIPAIDPDSTIRGCHLYWDANSELFRGP